MLKKWIYSKDRGTFQLYVVIILLVIVGILITNVYYDYESPIKLFFSGGNTSSWLSAISTVLLAIIGFFSYLSTEKSAQAANLSNKFIFYQEQKLVLKQMNMLVIIINTLAKDQIKKEIVDPFREPVDLLKLCFHQQPEIYDKCNAFWLACAHIEGYKIDKTSSKYLAYSDTIDRGLEDIIDMIENGIVTEFRTL